MAAAGLTSKRDGVTMQSVLVHEEIGRKEAFVQGAAATASSDVVITSTKRWNRTPQLP